MKGIAREVGAEREQERDRQGTGRRRRGVQPGTEEQRARHRHRRRHERNASAFEYLPGSERDKRGDEVVLERKRVDSAADETEQGEQRQRVKLASAATGTVGEQPD